MKYSSYHVKQLNSRKGKPWQGVLKYKNADGKWKETSKMFPEAKGKKEALRLTEKWFDEMNAVYANTPNADGARTVKEMVNEFIYYQHSIGQIELSTRDNHLKVARSYIFPYIGNNDFATLDKTAIQKWLTELNSKGLKQNSIRAAYSVLNKTYNYQLNMGNLIRNPLKGIKRPKESKPKVTHLTPKQMDDFLEAVYSDLEPSDKLYCAALLAFYGGLRRGEICGLRWIDVNFDTSQISINSAIGMSAEGAYTKLPKNASSIRTFPMLPQLETALRQRAELISPKPNWFVCGDGEKFFDPNTFSHQFQKLVRRNGLVDAYGKEITLHSLRHNLGAVGIKSGMDIASLSRMFGHASRAMTLDTYGDATKDAMIVAAGKLGETFDRDSEYFKMEEGEEE